MKNEANITTQIDLAQGQVATIRQIEANRRNALRSTGPQTDLGKQRSSQNAVRHGLTSETVITPFEDENDYKAFELAITADYEGETAVERELILRLASLLWRLRRASAIETRLFQTKDMSDGMNAQRAHEVEQQIAQCFTRLAKFENGLFELLGRYEVALWRQVRQILFTLDQFKLRKPLHRRRHPYP